MGKFEHLIKFEMLQYFSVMAWTGLTTTVSVGNNNNLLATFQKERHWRVKSHKSWIPAPLDADRVVAEQDTVETEQGKQVLVAKCAFSEQRNDSYVLASVVTGTLPRVELTGTTYCCCYCCCCCCCCCLYEWIAFSSDGRSKWAWWWTISRSWSYFILSISVFT